MQKITPMLWFDSQAEEAARFYVSIFKKNSKIGKIGRYTKTGPGAEGSVMTVDFVLDGQQYTALNGGPVFKFTEAISLIVNCGSQKEVDYFWEKLSEGGQKVECGWVKDKYGLSWQVTPTMLTKLIVDKDRDKVDRVMKAMMKMKKLDIKTLKEAAAAKR